MIIMPADMGSDASPSDRNGWVAFQPYYLLPPNPASLHLVNGEDASSIRYWRDHSDLAIPVAATLVDGRPASDQPARRARVWAKWW